ncbi:MAG: hypothetical protein ABEJ22_02740 [Haloferacaceae archaeon]
MSAPRTSDREDAATTVVVSYPEELSDWGRDQVESDRYVNYLRRVLDDVAVGDEFEEFADVGCCGDTLDIPFRVEAVEGPGRVGPETGIEFTTRDAEMEGGWLVQSQACEWED